MTIPLFGPVARRFRLAVLAVAVGAGAAAACAADDVPAQRERIAAERAAAVAAFDAAVAECRQRFVVNACLDDARRRQRDVLDRLHRQRLLLDDAQRKQRAAERVAALQSKAEAAGSPASGPAQRRALPPRSAVRLRQPSSGAAPREPAGDADAAASAPGAAASAASAARRASLEQARGARVREQRQRQADVQAHRDAVEARNARRAASGRPSAAPLPVPAVPTVPALAHRPSAAASQPIVTRAGRP